MSEKHEHDAACCHSAHAGGRVTPWAEAGAILLTAAFFAFSFFGGRVRFFVASYYVGLSLFAAAALAVMGAVRLVSHLRPAPADETGGHACAAGHLAWHLPSWLCVVALLAPIAMALAVNPTRYSSEGLRKRRAPTGGGDERLARAVAWVAGASGGGRTPGRPGTPVALPKNPTVVDLLNAARDADPAALDGQFVAVIGQCDLPAGGSGERFDLCRLIVTCCVADATAVMVEVVSPPGTNLVPGEWVRVEGILRFDSPADPSAPVIHATGVHKIAQPAEPYL